ncbi:MAG: 5'-methylthioadenosine/adenosylhomocysteine nucleosidase [Clostridia bacterium]|nr:5'-methylthioadenosine/adenosylhomocysteine nucleosidase [Clostridia bacterium]
MIGIIGAMNVEVEKLKNIIENKKTEIYSGIEFVSGQIYGKDVVVAKCGIGKVFAAICAQTMILIFSPSVVINTGVAGAIDSRLKIGSVAIGYDTVQYDMDTTDFGDPLGMISGLNIVHMECKGEAKDKVLQYADKLSLNVLSGTIASADRFLSDRDYKNTLKNIFSAIACDMESGSINHVCFVNDVDCVIVRAISDTADDESIGNYTEFLQSSAEKAVSVVLEYIKNN